MVSAIFYKNIVGVPRINDLILAKEHSMLTDQLDKLVLEIKVVSFAWLIESGISASINQGVQMLDDKKKIFTVLHRSLLRRHNSVYRDERQFTDKPLNYETLSGEIFAHST